MRPLRGLLLAMSLLWGACSEAPVEPQQARVLGNLLVVSTELEGAQGPSMVVDTGSPIVSMAPALVTNPPVPEGFGTFDKLRALGRDFSQVDVLFEPVASAQIADVRIAGALGCPLFCTSVLSMDYRGATVAVDRAEPPESLRTPNWIEFRVRGGGRVTFDGVLKEVPVPASRILLKGEFEDQPVTMMLDTGAGFTVVASALGARLLADGRGRVESGGPAAVRTSVFRARSIELGFVAMSDTPAVTGSSFDPLFMQLSDEVSEPVDVLLGGGFLREFYVEVNYPEGRLYLYRYPDREHITDEGHTLGLDISPFMAGDPTIRIEEVYEGTSAAAQGLQVGDLIASIDGVLVAQMNPPQIAAALSGRPGEFRTLELGCAGCPGTQGERVVSIDLDRLSYSP